MEQTRLDLLQGIETLEQGMRGYWKSVAFNILCIAGTAFCIKVGNWFLVGAFGMEVWLHLHSKLIPRWRIQRAISITRSQLKEMS